MDIIITKPADLQRLIDSSVEAATAKVIARVTPSSCGPKEWLTNREAMDFLGLSKTTLQRYRDSGRLLFSKIGGNIYYRYADVVAVLDQNRSVEVQHGDQ